MSNRAFLICTACLLSIGSQLTYGQASFSRGVNLSGWFQASTPQTIQFGKYTQNDFEQIRQLGCDVIRLPVNLHAMTSGAPDYTVDPLFWLFLDQAVGWAEEIGIHLIIDNHTFDPAVSTTADVEAPLSAVWPQVAARYAGRSDYILYEILNEPHGIEDDIWNGIQGRIVDLIRQYDSKHTIVVGPAGWNSFHNLEVMPQYADDNLIYTFHFYDPFLFTHQGASWTDPSLQNLANMPYPYAPSLMPSLPAEFLGSWIESSYNNYSSEGNVSHIQSLISKAVDFAQARSVPMFCGEFGVFMNNCRAVPRVTWYRDIRNLLENNNIAWTTWDYRGAFGLFEADSPERFQYDLNVTLLESLDLTVPPQSEWEAAPVKQSLPLYDDYSYQGALASGGSSQSHLSFYHENAHDGKFCIEWSNARLYENITFYLNPARDFSWLVSHGAQITFWARRTESGPELQVRLTDTDLGTADHPWRMNHNISHSMLPADDAWHFIELHFADFQDGGAWDDNQWYNPQPAFDWHQVNQLGIVAENGPIGGTVYFDDIHIEVSQTVVEDAASDYRRENWLGPVFPNPSVGPVKIPVFLPLDCQIELLIFDVSARLISTVTSDHYQKGPHHFIWNGLNNRGELIGSGLYMVILKAAGQQYRQKFIRIH